MIYKGDEPKFAVNLTAPGFDMDRDDFDIEITSTVGGRLKGEKRTPLVPGTDVRIFKETDGWYVIVDTANEQLLPGGTLTVIGTSYVPDANAADGTRKQTAFATLDQFKSK